MRTSQPSPVPSLPPPHPQAPAPQLPTPARGGSPAPSTLLQQRLISRTGQVHLTGRACATCHALAARETGDTGLGTLSSYSAAWALHLPRLIGRAFRCWMTTDKAKRPLQGTLKAKGTIMQRHTKHVLVLAQSNEMATAFLRVYI